MRALEELIAETQEHEKKRPAGVGQPVVIMRLEEIEQWEPGGLPFPFVGDDELFGYKLLVRYDDIDGNTPDWVKAMIRGLFLIRPEFCYGIIERYGGEETLGVFEKVG